MRYFGAHVSVAGGFVNAITEATELAINTIQIHPTAPQRWITKDIDTAGIETMVKAQKTSPVKLIFAHAIYLINLAQPDSQKFHLSKMALCTYLNFMGAVETIAHHYESDLRSGGVVVHVGTGIYYENRKEALDRCIEGINWILEKSPKGKLLLESSAGAGQVIGEKLEELMTIRNAVTQKDRVGIALDTQHMFASGYDWHNPQGVIDQLAPLLNENLIGLIHLNDSKVALGSKRDRHENIGEGNIGLESFGQILNAPELRDIPMVLETPRLKTESDARIEIETVKKLFND